jgi:ribosomal-protein-alanine N-acetyltransferase
MPIETKSLRLIPHIPQHLLASLDSANAYEKTSGLRGANGVREFVLAASPDFMAQLQNATAPDPWRFGFGVIHKIDNRLIGLCGFTGPPDSESIAEIAYSIAPDYQGKGYATEAAMALVDYAFQSGRVESIRAHTLPQTNASTRVLQKCGFVRAGESIDEGKIVWRWERAARK